jgi:hypothetical protein
MRGLFCVIYASATLLSQDAKSLDLKERPISKVINLLKDMSAELQKTLKEETELKEKMDCWCEVNEKEKNAAIEEANRRIDQLTASIGKNAGKKAELQATIKQVEKELGQNGAALDKATEVRKTEAAEFNQNEKDLVQSIGAMKNAVLVLSKHHEFLQTGSTVTKAAVKAIMNKARTEHKSILEAYVQQAPTNSGSYAPASGQIFGILKQMKEEFESNLAKMQEEEKTGQSDFADLKSAKQAEIAAGKTMSKEKTQALADAGDDLAKAKEDLDLTREALASDTKFLGDLRLRCQASDKDWELRAKTRNDEIAAISETIKILSDDDAFDLFSKTAGFLQTGAESQAQLQMRAKASRVLRNLGQKEKSLNLLALSQKVKLDGFVKVKKAIDEMAADLKTQLADEVKQRDFCVAEFQENEKQTLVKNNEIKDLSALIETQKNTISSLTDDIANLNSEIAEMKVQMKKASEDREGENHEFQQTVMDQRATQQILKKALARLESFYKKQALLQAEPGAAAPPPPIGAEGMGEYKANQGSGGVMMLIQNIIDEAHTAESDAIKAEAESQAGYEEFIKNSNDAIGAATKEITAKSDNKSETDAAKVQAEADRQAALGDAERLAQYNAELHQSCDFLTKNFDLRQSAIQQEIDGLAQAKSILSGADFGF